MTEEQEAVALVTLRGAEDNSLSFPEICRLLIAAGFERYAVDYARSVRTCYRPDGAFIEHATHRPAAEMGQAFDAAAIRAAIAQAQAGGPDYSYRAFCETVVAAGCAGYVVSFVGERAVYFGRTGETHVEHFPR